MLESPPPRYASAALALTLLLGHWAAGLAETPIRVTNFADGETIRYPVPLIRGELADRRCAGLTIVNRSSKRDTRQLTAPSCGGQFKALAELVPGRNELVLKAGEHETELVLDYRPQTNPYVVRVIYLTDSSGQTAYQTQLEDDPQDYAAKLDTAMKLMQTFTAEQMRAAGFGRVTFNLELDEDGRVEVYTVKGDHPAEFYYKMDGEGLFHHLYDWVDRRFPYSTGVNVVVTAFTRYDPAVNTLRGHTEIGGNGLALVGSGLLFTWPSGLGDVAGRFQDTRLLDCAKVTGDPVERGTFWSAASSSIGATLHELGHALGLFHCRDPLGIMIRGFDHFNRVFVLVEAPHRGTGRSIRFTDDQTPRWAPVSTKALKPTRYFALDAKPYQEGNQPRLTVRQKTRQMLIEASHGVRFIGYDNDRTTMTFNQFLDAPKPPKQVGFNLDELRRIVGSDRIRVRIIDDQGHLVMTELDIAASAAAGEKAGASAVDEGPDAEAEEPGKTSPSS